LSELIKMDTERRIRI